MATPAEQDPNRRASPWRKIAAASWDDPSDPAVHGMLELDVTRAEQALARLRESGPRITPTHLVAWAVARALADNPEANVRLRFGRVVPRDAVDLFLQVALEGDQLSGVKIRGADRLSLAEIARATAASVAELRSGAERTFSASFRLARRLPGFLLRPLLGLSSLLGNDFGLSLPALGVVRDPFGSAMISSLGMHGIDAGWPPLFPHSRCPLVVVVGEIQDRPWVVEGQVVARRVLRLCATFDHRLIDGVLAGRLAKSLRAALEEFAAGPDGV